MPVFKAFFEIVKKNKMTFILAVAINLAITFAYYQVNRTDTGGSFEASKNTIGIINQDSSPLAKQLEDYLTENATVVEIGTSKTAQQDALFYKEVLFIVTIPADFSTQIADGQTPILPTKAVPNSQAEFQLTALINQYINKVSFYKTHFPEKNEDDILEMVSTNLAQEANISFINAGNSDTDVMTARTFNLLAYGLFMTILSSIGLVSISMNRKDLKDRNNCSPLSQRKRSAYFYLGVTIFSLGSWLLFVTMSILLTKSDFSNPMMPLMLLNAFIFLLAMISLAVTVAYFVTTTEMISGLNNILVLGTCFLSGVFVPQEMMSEPVLKLSSFFPTYWFVTNNNLLANLKTFNAKTLEEYYFNLGILLLFVLAFALIGFIVRREQGGLAKKAVLQ